MKCSTERLPSRVRIGMQHLLIYFEKKWDSPNPQALRKYPGKSRLISFYQNAELKPSRRTCKSLIRKLLVKDEVKRLGSRAGASDVKAHPFFRSTQWALLRHMRPPMIPTVGKGADAVNFRLVKESESVDISASRGTGTDQEAATPGEKGTDPFEDFNSVTLHHDGDHDHHHHVDTGFEKDRGGTNT
ncbi:serine/threonine protein kinase, AGC [Orbilia oligospora]|uniref:non-specific serine/threonine protein kinase n=1 Tax=Orbilia oligospora TaxID=2813651 RepID=A0A7C8V7C5_ORBOL|nr:serine/threonine protein kinase, AGC [Orbilia oligospora]